jgi:hypothetical protein
MYDYETVIKELLGSEEGVALILQVWENARKLLDGAPNFRREQVSAFGDSWQTTAAVDYLCKIGRLTELRLVDVPDQRRLFERGPNFLR